MPVVVGDVPENRLEVACSRGLVDGIDYLLEAVGNHLVERAAAFRQVHNFPGVPIIVVAILFSDKIIQVHQKLGCGAGTAEHTRYDEYHIDESSAE